MLNASPRMLKHIAMLGALVTATWIGTAMAQISSTNSGPTPAPAPAPTSGSPATVPETDTMEHYLNNHPQVADELHNDPSLINNPAWLAKHPTVQNWMNNHPNVKQDAAMNPKNFVDHTEHETLRTDRQALNNTDDFLSKHPGLAKQLNDNPKLIDDPKFLADHPALNTYMKDHPSVANEWRDHPNAFADAARAEERYNKTGQVPKPIKKK